MRHKAVVRYDSQGKETCCKIDFGVMPVRLPWRKEELRLVVVRGFGRKPMMLLTNLAVDERLQAEGKDGTLHTYEALWQVVEGYLSRWRIEETIRFIKQCYGFENIRALRYERRKNMTALLLVTAYFAAAWLGRDVRKDVLVDHIEHLHQRFSEVPDFFLYALAAGLRRAFTRYGKWTSRTAREEREGTVAQAGRGHGPREAETERSRRGREDRRSGRPAQPVISVSRRSSRGARARRAESRRSPPRPLRLRPPLERPFHLQKCVSSIFYWAKRVSSLKN